MKRQKAKKMPKIMVRVCRVLVAQRAKEFLAMRWRAGVEVDGCEEERECADCYRSGWQHTPKSKSGDLAQGRQAGRDDSGLSMRQRTREVAVCRWKWKCGRLGLRRTNDVDEAFSEVKQEQQQQRILATDGWNYWKKKKTSGSGKDLQVLKYSLALLRWLGSKLIRSMMPCCADMEGLDLLFSWLKSGWLGGGWSHFQGSVRLALHCDDTFTHRPRNRVLI